MVIVSRDLINLFKTEQILPHYILEESIFDFRYSRLYDVDIPKGKWLIYLQTVETLIRHHILLCLIWVCTVCQIPVGVSSLQGVNEEYSVITLE